VKKIKSQNALRVGGSGVGVEMQKWHKQYLALYFLALSLSFGIY